MVTFIVTQEKYLVGFPWWSRLYASHARNVGSAPDCRNSTIWGGDKEGKILCNTILLLYCSFFLDVCHHYCVNSESCTIGDDGSVECVCPIRYEGSKCEIDKCIRCHGGHCIINKDSEDISCK